MFHYVYRITNIKLKKHYYGCRSSKIEPKLDLGKKYFSSSKDKDFLLDQKECPSNYKYKIIKIFDTREEALSLEIILHNKFEVGLNDSFYNKSKQTNVKFDTTGCNFSYNIGKNNPMFGLKRDKHSELMLGEKNPFFGKIHSDETKQKCSQKNKNMIAAKNIKSGEILQVSRDEFENNIDLVGVTFGKHLTKETREKISKSSKGVKKPKCVCPYCGLLVSRIKFERYHKNNCESKDLLETEHN